MRPLYSGAAAALALVVSACGADQPSSDATQAFSQLTQAATQFAEQAQQMAAGKTEPVPPVSYQTLLDYLPRDVDGMKAGEPKGETGSAGQWQYSQAKVEFSSDGGPRAEVAIFDYAFIPILYAPYEMMLTMKVKREGTDGYERTTEVRGFPAFEQWEKQNRKSEVAVMVGDRFIVTAEVRGGEEGSSRQLAERVDLKGLAGEGSK